MGKVKAGSESKTSPAQGIPNRLPAVPESVLKRRRRRDASKVAQVKNTLKKRSESRKKKKDLFKRAEQLLKDRVTCKRDEMRLLHQARTRGNHYTPKGGELAFVIRIGNVSGTSPKVQKVLKLLRLNQANTGTFIKLNKATVNLLRVCEPYVTWGTPNLKSVRELIYKRGFAKIEGQRVPITSNEMIEKKLGKANIVCLEDLIHEIFTIGPKFNYASNFIWPFKLHTPSEGYSKKSLSFAEGGDYGDRGEKINELIRRML